MLFAHHKWHIYETQKARPKLWAKLNIAPTVSRAKEVDFEQVQMIQDDKYRSVSR